MYPQIHIAETVLFSFGVFLSLSVLVFFWMTHRLCLRYSLRNIFGQSFWLYIPILFLFSRLLYIVAEWRDFKFITGGVFHFLFMSDYNFSFTGFILAFAICFLILTRKQSILQYRKYLDIVVISLMFTLIFGYIGAFLGGQIYGTPTQIPFGVLYTSPYNIHVPGVSSRIPLALIYSFGVGSIFSLLYMARVVISIPGVIGYTGILLFASMLGGGEIWNGNEDIIASYVRMWLGFSLNLNQITSLFFIFFAFRGIMKISKPSDISLE